MSTPNNQHHVFGGSVLWRRELCPASCRAEENLPDVTSEDSIEGTRLHEEVADCLTKCVWTHPDERVQYCLDAVRNVICEGEITQIKCESPLQYVSDDGKILTAGTADLVMFVDGTWHIFDWKFGFGDIMTAPNNLQLASYALSLMQRERIGTVVVHLVCAAKKQTTEYTHRSEKVIRQIIEGIVRKCGKKNAEYRTGEHCKYCKANLHGTCPAIRKSLATLADHPAELLATADDETIGKLYEQSQRVEKLQQAVKAEMQKRIRENGSCGDYTERTISGGYGVNVNATLLVALKACGIPESEVLKAMSISFSALLDLYCKHNATPSLKKKELRDNFEMEFSDFLVQKPSRNTIVKNQPQELE